MGKKGKYPANTKLMPDVKTVLDIIAAGALISSLFLFPGAAVGIGAIFSLYEKLGKEKEIKKLNTFDLRRLKLILKRLHDQKMVEVVEENSFSVVKLTDKGKFRTYRYKLDEIRIEKPQIWDRKWRIIIYDISKFKRRQRDAFRRMLKKLKVIPIPDPLPMQKRNRVFKGIF